MKTIIDGLNWISDQDWSWWPLVNYRPPKDKIISKSLVLRMTTVFGPLSGLAIAAIAQHLQSLTYLFIDIVIGLIAYYTIYRSIFVSAWNFRARSFEDKHN